MTKKCRNGRIYIYIYIYIPQCTSPISHYAPFCNRNISLFQMFLYLLYSAPTLHPLPSTQHPLPTDVYHACIHFRQNRCIFSLGGAHSWNPEKKCNFSGMSPRKGWNFAYIFFLFAYFAFELWCINVFELKPYIGSNEKCDVHRKISLVW